MVQFKNRGLNNNTAKNVTRIEQGGGWWWLIWFCLWVGIFFTISIPIAMKFICLLRNFFPNPAKFLIITKKKIMYAPIILPTLTVNHLAEPNRVKSMQIMKEQQQISKLLLYYKLFTMTILHPLHLRHLHPNHLHLTLHHLRHLLLASLISSCMLYSSHPNRTLTTSNHQDQISEHIC